MELFNELPQGREQSIEDFLTFIPIYESKKRFIALRALLRRHKAAIRGAHCAEAGAGRGLFAEEMQKLGAASVTAVERSPALFQILKSRLQNSGIRLVRSDITSYKPASAPDVLFHEFYGPLVLDEAMLALRKLRFTPGLILPDGGSLWAMPLRDADIRKRDDQYEPSWKQSLSGALISDVFAFEDFKPKWKVFDWNVHSPQTAFRFCVPSRCDWIALCGEITHTGKSVLKLWTTGNWPVIYTPVNGSEFEIKFVYSGGYTKVYFRWLK